MTDDKTRDDGRHPGLVEIGIDGFTRCKVERFDAWLSVVAEMIGAPVRYELCRRAVRLHSNDPSVPPPQTLQFLEAVVTDPARMIDTTPEIRRGIWHETPDEPLWILVLLTVPGGTLFARNACAIAERLGEIDEVVHAASLGLSTHFHQAARQWFAEQAKTGTDVVIDGGFEPTGWWLCDLAEADPLPAR